MNTIYLRTAKAESEGSRLSTELKRVLFLLDGRSGSDDLAKRAAPSLRNRWGEIISELVKRGYIVSNPGANFETKVRSMPKSGAAASADIPAHHKLRSAEQVIAELETAAVAHKVNSDIANERVIAALETAASTDKAKFDLGAKAKADTQQKLESAARTAELKNYFAAAKEKARVEIQQSEQEAARARAEMQAAATAKKMLDAEAMANAAAKKRELENARAAEAARARAKMQAAATAKKMSDAEAMANATAKKRGLENARAATELEMAIHAAKIRSDIVEKLKIKLKSINEMHANDSHRLRELETENEALKQLLVDAYVENATLKASSGKKP